VLQPLCLQYQQLQNKNLDDYYGDTAAMPPEHMLDVMVCFPSLNLIQKFGELHGKCPCVHCANDFRRMACHHTALFSAPWDLEVRVPEAVPTVFNQFQCRQGAGRGSAVRASCVWQPKIAGIPVPITPPLAKRGKRGG
jgi:hypothetical protein